MIFQSRIHRPVGLPQSKDTSMEREQRQIQPLPETMIGCKGVACLDGLETIDARSNSAAFSSPVSFSNTNGAFPISPLWRQERLCGSDALFR